MTRTEHLQWCKDRAIEYAKAGDTQQAFASFGSDMAKHPETATHSALHLGFSLFFAGHLNSATEMEKWINGFN